MARLEELLAQLKAHLERFPINTEGQSRELELLRTWLAAVRDTCDDLDEELRAERVVSDAMVVQRLQTWRELVLTSEKVRRLQNACDELWHARDADCETMQAGGQGGGMSSGPTASRGH